MIRRGWDLKAEAECDQCGRRSGIKGWKKMKVARTTFKQGWFLEPWDGGASWTFCPFCWNYMREKSREIIKGWKS